MLIFNLPSSYKWLPLFWTFIRWLCCENLNFWCLFRLSLPQKWTKSNVLLLLTVINELEGLSRGIKQTSPANVATKTLQLFPAETVIPSTSRVGNRSDPQHAAMVANASKSALLFLKSKSPAVKWVVLKEIIFSLIF